MQGYQFVRPLVASPFSRSLRNASLAAVALLSLAGSVACTSSGVSSSEEAQAAYVGLDASIDRAITLGFAGFNTASSANIAPQSGNGTKSGTMTVSGQVDQGSSANKGMRLTVKMAGYSDDGKLTYNTNDAALPKLDLDLKGIPNGTLTGTMTGTYTISGDLKGDVALNLSFAGTLQPSASDAKAVERKPGTTHITGTATSGDSVYTVDVTR
jgi:hypothetical protein